MAWVEQIVQGLKDADVGLIAYVPDGVTWRVLRQMEADPFFHMVPTTREEEAVGIISGAYAAGRRGAVFMQSSGFGNSINALATLNIPYRIPVPAVHRHARRARRVQPGAGAGREGHPRHPGRPGAAVLST